MTHRDEDSEIIDSALDHLAWQRREIDRLTAEVERLRELLEPFIEAADEADESGLEDSEEAPISCGQCREARAALGDTQ